MMKLHRTLFVEKRGTPGVNELVEQRRKERVAQDHRRAVEFNGKIKKLNAEMDEKFRNALQGGSMTIWTKAENDRIEEARQDPDEARERMTTHLNELASTFKQTKVEMGARVRNIPSLNLPPRSFDEEAVEKRASERKEQVAQTSREHWRTVRGLKEKYAAERQAFVKTNVDAIITRKKDKGLQQVRRQWHGYMDFIDDMEERLENKRKDDLRARNAEGQQRKEFFEERQKAARQEMKQRRQREIEYWAARRRRHEKTGQDEEEE